MTSFATDRVLWMAFIDQGQFEAMKTLSGCRAPRCDKHQLRAKMTVSTQNFLRDIVVEHNGLNNKKDRRMRKMALWLPHTFAFSCLPRSFWPLIWVLLITKALKEEAWALNKLLACLWWSYTAFAQKYCIYCASAPSIYIVYRLSDT